MKYNVVQLKVKSCDFIYFFTAEQNADYTVIIKAYNNNAIREPLCRTGYLPLFMPSARTCIPGDLRDCCLSNSCKTYSAVKNSLVTRAMILKYLLQLMKSLLLL